MNHLSDQHAPLEADLWVTLRDQLQSLGDLPLRHEMLTPAEIAQELASATGDPRVRQFVWYYYYPRRYGGQEGAMTDQEAAELVASFRKRPPRREDKEMPAPGADPEMCGVCRHREVPRNKKGG